jgi:protein translocase SecG subunit
MSQTLTIAQVIISLLIIVTILVQEKGSGLGEAIGGTGGASNFQTTKRGAEKVLSQVTIILLIAFIAVSLVLNFI